MEGTHSGGSYGEVSSQQDRSKHYSSRSKHHNHNYTHYSPRCKYHNPNYTRYSPRCKYHSPRHTLSKEIECIANIFYQKSPVSCTRHKVFQQKECIENEKHYLCPPFQHAKQTISAKRVYRGQNDTYSPDFQFAIQVFSAKRGYRRQKTHALNQKTTTILENWLLRVCADRHRSLTAKRLTVKEHLKICISLNHNELQKNAVP